nr:CU044_5270 family protein [Paenarthrobacter aurescens]
MHRYAATRAGESVADDVMAQTFLVAFESRESFDHRSEDARPWLFGIATNLLRRHHRAEARRLKAFAKAAGRESYGDGTDRVAERLDAAATTARLATAMRKLSSADRECLLLYAWADLTYDGIALATGVPVGTVRSRLNRARRILRDAAAQNHTEDKEIEQDELALLRAMREKTPVPKDSTIEEGRERLLHRISPSLASAWSLPTRKRKGSKKVGISLVAAVAAVAVLVAVDVIGPTGWRGAATAQAAQVLNDAAQTTIQNADPVVNPGQYLKIESSNLWGSTSVDENGRQFQWLDIENMTMYIPANRMDEWVWERSGRIPTVFFDEASKEYAMNGQLGTPTGETLRAVNGGFYGPPEQSGFPSANYLDSLPRDPYLLLNNIYKKTLGHGQSVDGEALVFIADLLRSGMVPADLRAALYKAAALIPGVTVTDAQATLNGRVGVAIGRVEDASHSRQDIIIDPATGLLIGEREVLTQAQGNIPAGTAITLTAIETTVSDSAP